MKNRIDSIRTSALNNLLKDALYGFTIAVLLIVIILFSSGTTKFVYIDF
jgi:hypothetical protein